MKAHILFKSGQSIEFQCDELTTKTSPITGELVRAEWVGAVGYRPLYVALDQIAAVCTSERDGDTND